MSRFQVRALITALNVLLLLAIAQLVWPSADARPVAATPTPALPAPWMPPAWHPNAAGALQVLPSIDGMDVAADGPRIRSKAAIVVDLDRHEVVWSHRADEPRPVASLTKMVSALALASTQADMDQTLCVDFEQWPSRPGARSRFETGKCHTGWEYLGAALVASDNRGAMAFPALAGLEYGQFLGRMDEVATHMGLELATWTDPAGLEDDNMATARDMAKAVTALASHPTLAMVASAPHWDIDRVRGKRHLPSTNRLLRTTRATTVAAKTGYTSTAGWCFASVMQLTSGGRYAVVVLGARSQQARFDEALHLVRWAERRQQGSGDPA